MYPATGSTSTPAARAASSVVPLSVVMNTPLVVVLPSPEIVTAISAWGDHQECRRCLMRFSGQR
ncbi:hypothetical protein GCM10010104_40570 [Streptomyces indiaensis]|uniref:Uncharacterized protein n=1 Tax=Streptomyces indiaensis TaxID=284033 RepID=A0ABN3DT95_9ACTN